MPSPLYEGDHQRAEVMRVRPPFSGCADTEFVTASRALGRQRVPPLRRAAKPAAAKPASISA